MRKLLLVGAIWAAAHSVSAQNFDGNRWIQVGTTPEGDRLYIDKSSAQITEDYEAKVWIRIVNATREQWAGTTIWSTSHQTLTTFHCRSREYSTEYVAIYDESKLVFSSRMQIQHETILPETAQEALYEAACKGKYNERDSAAEAAREAKENRAL